MLYEVRGSYHYPDLPTENLVDVSLYYSKNILVPIEIKSERPIFNALDLEELALTIVDERREIENEFKKKSTKKKMSNFHLLNIRYLAYLEGNERHAKNRIFSSFLDDVQHQFLLVLSLLSYKNYPLVLDDVFRQHYFEYRFISYLTTYFYYESVKYDKNIRRRNERETATLDSSIEEGLTLKDSIPANEKSSSSRETFKDLLTNDLLIESFKILSNQQQSILNYYYVKGYKEREISDLLDISQQAVSKAKRKAIEKLKKLMKGG
ncbi:sigma-70 family RNA polymerase sigma factor [Bacillus salitolerans]|uniref:Sigma-70 family RNA polymerase sigma factor n=1 Tax=Bacillus salitolerans TaxID=1437434 RepID=A0ABW4LXD6_9BACI